MSLLPYSPLAGGVLAAKYQGGVWPPAARFSFYREFGPRTKVMTARFVNEQSLAATARFGELAKECGMSLPRFAIAWTLSRDFVGSTLVGATSPEQLEETLAAAQVSLPPDALAKVDAISREIRYPLG